MPTLPVPPRIDIRRRQHAELLSLSAAAVAALAPAGFSGRCHRFCTHITAAATPPPPGVSA